jgi:hypothetical protein
MKQWLAMVAIGSLFLLGGCADDGSDPGLASADVPDWLNTDVGVKPPPTTTPPGGPNCAFDENLVGTKVGDHIANLQLKDVWGSSYNLHSKCGTTTKAIWVVLAAGW